MTRRDLLKLVAAAGGGAVVAPLGAFGSPADRAHAGGAPLDVAIVGGGVSGVYTAWRLSRCDPARSVVLRPLAAASPTGRLSIGLFEASDRVGGRICSLRPDGMPYLRAELGGMRFPSTHTLVRALVEHLGLATQPFPVSDGANFHYLRGHRFRARSWRTPGTLPYALGDQERDKSLDDLLIEAIEHVVPGARGLDAGAWGQLKAVGSDRGVSLYDAGFRHALLQKTTAEALALIRDAGGYGTFYGSWNAAEMSSWIMADFLGSPKYSTIVDGYDALPRAMAMQFEEAGGLVSQASVLRRVRRDDRAGDGVLALDFVDRRGEAAVTVRARHVILAMPRRALELLAPDTVLNSSPQFRRDLTSVSPQAAGKVFLGYRRAWWRDLGIVAGRSTTDLPLRQCYYFSSDAPGPTGDEGGLLMASYHDGDDVPFWSTLNPVLAPGAPFTTAPSASLIDEAQRQLREFHGSDARIPEPTWAVYANWTADPYGAAWHFWNPHTRPAEVSARMLQPLPDARVYVCGEAWSTDQGWVRGALRTGESVLQDKLGVPPPRWLDADEHLRPQIDQSELEGVSL